MRQAFRLSAGDAEFGCEGIGALTARLHQRTRRQAVRLPEGADRLGQPPADRVPEKLEQRFAVPAELDPHPDPSLELSGDALAGPFERPEFFPLRVPPFGQQVPAMVPILRLRAFQRRLPLLERAQLFDSAAEPDELLAVDSGFLERPELLFVLGLHRGPARLEPFVDAPEPLIGLGERRIECLRHLVEVRVQLLQDPIRASQDLLPGQVFQRPRGQEDPVDR